MDSPVMTFDFYKVPTKVRSAAVFVPTSELLSVEPDAAVDTHLSGTDDTSTKRARHLEQRGDEEGKLEQLPLQTGDFPGVAMEVDAEQRIGNDDFYPNSQPSPSRAQHVGLEAPQSFLAPSLAELDSLYLQAEQAENSLHRSFVELGQLMAEHSARLEAFDSKKQQLQFAYEHMQRETMMHISGMPTQDHFAKLSKIAQVITNVKNHCK
jgi:hypothetical protein